MDIKKEEHGYAMVEHNGKYTVVEIDRPSGQVYSAMPTDHPLGGGKWFARMGDSGIEYVSKWYSRGYAMRVFRRLVSERVRFS
jgi:hypothetical protein